MTLLSRGSFTLHSGARSWFKIDCDALTDEDLEVIAAIIAGWFPLQFGHVDGVPRGGLRLAEKLRKYQTSYLSTRLIVDDVLTTGASMEAVFDAFPNNTPILGAVIFARTKPPAWIRPVFQL